MRAGAGLARSGRGGEALPPEPRFPLQRGQMPPLAWDTSGTSHLLPPLARAHLIAPLARARWAAIDRGLTLGVTQGMQPRPSSWALTQVAGLPGVLEPQAPGSSCAHCLGHRPRLPLLAPGSGARACAPASGGPQGVRPAPPRPRAD